MKVLLDKHAVQCRPTRARRAPPARAEASEGAEPVKTASVTTKSSGTGKVLDATLSKPTRDTPAYSKSTAELKNTLEVTRNFLESELRTVASTGVLTRDLYSDKFAFENPLGSLSGFGTTANVLTALRALNTINYTLDSLKVTGASELTARWAVTTKSRIPLPWQPGVVLTGKSIYQVDLITGAVISQTDEWDALPSSKGQPLAAAALLLRQGLSLQTTPGNLESPSYSLLKRAPGYELRRYDSYLVAETKMPTSEGPAGGTGFQSLANYIFGGNRQNSRMEMTTPVFSTSSNTMQFPLERKAGASPQALPTPDSDKVTTKEEEGGVYGVISFSGIPLDFQVTEAERRLRGLLLLDGLKPTPGYRLARYNDPFTLPAFRRNEVLVGIKDYKPEE